MTVLLDDPGLERRSPGEEFARAHASAGPATRLALRASLTTMFPPSRRRPRLTVRDLMKVATVTAERVRYPRETIAADGPAEAAGAASAPEARFAAGTEEAAVAAIRAAVDVPLELFGDAAALAAYIDYRLVVRACTAENDALLNGTGPGGVVGLRQVEGTRTQAARATVPETLLAAAATCEEMGGSADGIVLHPADWWPLLQAGGFLANLAAAGVRTSRTRMLPRGVAIVGDFLAAATVLDRRSSTIRFAGEEDGWPAGAGPRLVAEVREGLAVHLPGHFVLTALPG
jgi:Phage capsid family